MSHDRSLRAPVWKVIFEVFGASLIPVIIGNRAQPKYVPVWLVIVCLFIAVIALVMWMHDAGYATFVSSRIDDHRERIAANIRANEEAWKEQIANGSSRMWTTSVQMSSTSWNGHTFSTVNIQLSPPVSPDHPIGVVNARCRVIHVGHGAYVATQGVANGSTGLSSDFPGDFRAEGFSSLLSWPLPEGEYQIDWTGMPGYATRQRFNIGKNGNFA